MSSAIKMGEATFPAGSFRRYAAAATLLLIGACSSPTESVPCETRWSDVRWSSLGLDGAEVSALAETDWGLFAGTRGEGVFRQDPSSGAWQGRGLEDAEVNALGWVGPPPRLLAGVGGSPTGAVFATEDAGAPWHPSDAGFPVQETTPDLVRRLAVDTADSRRVFAGARAGVLRSTDAGASWELVLRWNSPPTGLGVAPAGVVLAGFSTDIGIARLLRSADEGESWDLVELPFGSIAYPSAFAVDPVTPSRIWMGLPGAVRRSDDGGVTWGDSQELSPGRVIGLAASEDAVTTALSRDNPDHQDVQIYVSCDLGDTWELITAPAGIRGAEAIILSEDGSLLLGTTGAGVWRLEAVGR